MCSFHKYQHLKRKVFPIFVQTTYVKSSFLLVLYYVRIFCCASSTLHSNIVHFNRIFSRLWPLIPSDVWKGWTNLHTITKNGNKKAKHTERKLLFSYRFCLFFYISFWRQILNDFMIFFLLCLVYFSDYLSLLYVYIVVYYMTIHFPVKLTLTSKTHNFSVVVVCISLTSNASARICEKSTVGKCYIWLFLASDIKP